MFKVYSGAVSLLVLSMFTEQSYAEDNSDFSLEEVVVTAERRSVSAQDTALSLEVRMGEQLQQQGKFSLSEILEDIPGVAITDDEISDSPGSNIVIRGAVPHGTASGNVTVPTTAVYVDGVYSGVGGNYDINRVEVLRGPQGTLYGRSATSGVVALYTNDPVLGELSTDVTLEAGNYNRQHGTVVTNLPLTDTLSVRAAVNYFSRDGYVSKDGGALDSVDAKVKLLYQPSDDFSFLVGLAAQRNDTHAGGINQVQETAGEVIEVEVPVVAGENDFDQIWARIVWETDFGTLSYVPAYRSWEQATADIFSGPAGLTLVQAEETPSDTFMTHELLLSSQTEAGVTWQLGMLYYKNEYESVTGVSILPAGDIVFENSLAKNTTDIGMFGEANFPFADTWGLTVGLRYNYTKVEGGQDYTTATNPFGLAPFPNEIVSVALAGDEGVSTFNNLTFKLRLEHELNDSSLLYGMVSSGFLPGDVQITTVTENNVTVPKAIEYDVESVTAFEIGSKNRLLDDRLQLNGTVFYYDYAGYQTTANTSLDNPGFAFVNSPAEMYGLEADSVFRLTPADKIGLSIAYLHGEFVDQSPEFSQYVDNTDIPNVPTFTVYANYEHQFSLANGSRFFVKLDARFVDGYLSENVHPEGALYGATAYSEIDSQVITNLSGTWISADEKYSVTGYVRNLADNDYFKQGRVTGYSVEINGTRTVTDAEAATYDPRTFGLVIQMGF